MLGPCFVLLYFVSIISLGKRELIALLLLGSECHVMGWSVDCDCNIYVLFQGTIFNVCRR